jgi:hypothetical protein
MFITEEHVEALNLLAAAADRSKRRNVAFARSFIRDPLQDHKKDQQDTPLGRLIHGGRGGEVRLKLYLLLRMIATSAPYDIKRLRTPQTLARTLELPKANGARRINSNLKWLVEHNFIDLRKQPPHPPSVQLLDPLNKGNPLPSPRATKPYVTIPIEFWRNGWLLDLSPTAIAVLFALKERLGAETRHLYMMADRKASYCLSHDTWTRGTGELKSRSLLSTNRVPQGDDFDPFRLRTAYRINWDKLKEPSSLSKQPEVTQEDQAESTMLNFR